MKLKKAELLEALNKVRPAVSEKAIVEQADHFVLDKGYIRTYNGEVAISYPFKTDLCMAVKADIFFQLISKIEQEEFELGVKDGSITISSGRLDALIVAAEDVKCPTVVIKSRGKWSPLPENFSDAIRFCSFSAGRDEGLGILMYLWIKDQYVVSSDNFRVSKYEMASKVVTEMLLSAKAASQLHKYSPTHYAMEDAWIHFKNSDGAIFSARIFDGEYPEEVWNLFTIKGDKVPIPEGLLHAIEEARIFTQDNQGSSADLIQITVKGGKLQCRGQGALGYAGETFKIDYKKKDFEFNVSPDALMEILTHENKEMRVGSDKLYFNGPNFEHVIALI